METNVGEKEKKPFNDLLSESIDEVLTSLGSTVRNMIYLYLNSHLHISKDEIPYRMTEFFETLEKLFGFGAKNLEKQILQTLQEKTQIMQPLMAVENSLEGFVVFVRQEYEESWP